jgi:Secretion system C-terminal sorting domain
MKNTWISFMVVALCGSVISHAQILTFSGGFGGGSVLRSSAQITLSGNTDLVAFKGGNGNGNTIGKSIIIQLGNSDGVIFSGGIGNGSNTSISNSLSLSGVNQNFNFSGGSGNGVATSRSIILKLEGSSYLSIPFFGGSGNGNIVTNSSLTTLDGTQMSLSYNGGYGHGSNISQSLVLFMSGNNYQYSYTGGSGRGNTQLLSKKLTLSGIISPGFARVVAKSVISDFRVVPRNNQIRLNWRADNQEILDHFVVERSNDGIDFNPIGYVGSNSDHHTGLFSFPHLSNENGTEFFRLLEIFKDSSFSYSSVLKVATTGENSTISLFPNPVRDKLNVSLPATGRSEVIQIFDYSGQLIKEISVLGNDKVEINTENLPAGLYWLETGIETARNRIRFTRL